MYIVYAYVYVCTRFNYILHSQSRAVYLVTSIDRFVLKIRPILRAENRYIEWNNRDIEFL